MNEKPKTRLVREHRYLNFLGESYDGPAWFATRWPDDPDCPIRAEDALRTFLTPSFHKVQLVCPPKKVDEHWFAFVLFDTGEWDVKTAGSLTLLPEPEREERCEARLCPEEVHGPGLCGTLPCALPRGHEGDHRPDQRTHQRREGERRASGQRRRPQPSFYQTNDRRSSISRRRNADDRRTGKDRRS